MRDKRRAANFPTENEAGTISYKIISAGTVVYTSVQKLCPRHVSPPRRIQLYCTCIVLLGSGGGGNNSISRQLEELRAPWSVHELVVVEIPHHHDGAIAVLDPVHLLQNMVKTCQ